MSFPISVTTSFFRGDGGGDIMAGIGTVHTSMTADGVIIEGFLPGMEKCREIGGFVIGITCGEGIRGDPLASITVG